MATTSIIPLLDGDAALEAARGAGLADVLARVNLFRLTLNHPPIGRIVGDAVDALVMSSVLDVRLRELAILRVGWRVGSVYEWSNHYAVAKRAGMSDDDIVAVRDGEVASLDPAARAVIAVVDEGLDNVAVSRATLEAARAHVGDDRALLELVAIPGLYRAIATLLLTFDVPLEDHVAPWAPDGRRPAS